MSPYGAASADLGFTSIGSAILSAGTVGSYMLGAVATQSLDPTHYLVVASLNMHLSQQETFIATGGSGIGILVGSHAGLEANILASQANLSIQTSLGNCCLPGPYAYAFVFGKPFTIDVEGDLNIGASPPLFGTGLGIGAAGVGFFASGDSVFDVTGRPIPNVTFTVVPEPATAVLAGAGLLLVGVFAARSMRVSRRTSIS